MRLHTRTCSVLFLLVYCIALVLALSNRFFPPTNHSPGLVRSSRNGYLNPSSDASPSRRTLSKRTTLNRNLFYLNYELGFGWYCYFNLLDTVRPVGPLPVQHMEEFFSAVLSLGGAIWAHEPALSYRVATLGEITLRMVSSEPIQWDWIYHYLLGAASKINGFSPRMAENACSLSADTLDQIWHGGSIQDYVS